MSRAYRSTAVLFTFAVAAAFFQNCGRLKVAQSVSSGSQGEALLDPNSPPPPSPSVENPGSPAAEISLAQQKLINVAFVEGTWRPLLGVTPGQRSVVVSDLKTVKVYAESALRADAKASPAVQRNLAAGVFAVSPTTDYDGDGVIDVLVLDSVAGAANCDDGQNAAARSIAVLSGKDPANLLYKSNGILDVCVPVNGGPTARVQGVHVGAFQFGEKPALFALTPQYYPNGWFANGPGSATHFYTPSGSNFAAYGAARAMLQPSAGGLSYQFGGQPLNGLLLEYAGTNRYVATTSGRFLNYGLTAYSATQLVTDTPFLARNDLVGRNYGLIQHDKTGNARNVFLIAGAVAQDLFADVKKSGTSGVVNGTDLWGGIERHVSSLDLSTGAVKQKFYSYAHDNTDGHTYRHRVTYPSYARLPSKEGAGSRMIYNVFDGTTWGIHISVPGGTDSQSYLANYYVWDVIPVDDDTADIVASPVDTARKIMIPNFISANGQVGSWRPENYFPQMRTVILRWTRAADSASTKQIIEGGIPLMDVVFPHRGTEANGTGYLYPTLRAYDSKTGRRAVLLMYKSAGETFEAPLDP